ncbi:phosphate signaling complex protein PhoU [Paradesulfitobacterium aromaticivorans]
MNMVRLTGYDKALMELRALTVELGNLVSAHLGKAADVILNDAAQLDWRASDNVIDRLRDRILNRSFEMMSLQQLRPQDLHWILGFQRIAQELERIADYACDLAELHALNSGQSWPDRIRAMTEHLVHMFEETVEVMHADREFDRDVDEQDDLLDQGYAKLQEELFNKKSGTDANSGLILIMARTLERMGDHVVNVAEMHMYAKTGQRRLKPRDPQN